MAPGIPWLAVVAAVIRQLPGLAAAKLVPVTFATSSLTPAGT